MAQKLLLKVGSDSIPTEHDSSADEITFASFTVQGGGPVLGATGLDLNGQAATDAASFQVTDPTVGFLNQTAGNLIFNNIMAKERENTLTTAAGIAFPVISDVGGEVDAFRLPALAGAPTASPTNGGEGHLVWDSANNKLYAWDGAAWDDLSTVSSAENIDRNYIAEVSVAARDVVYISSAGNVSPADADAVATSRVIGLATAAAAPTVAVPVRKLGVVSGFSGLTAGAPYYLSATAGAITATAPTGTGKVRVQVGYALSATELDISIQRFVVMG